MSKLILVAPAVAVLCLGACKYNKENYNAANAEYNAEEANYAGNEAAYGNAAEYNATNETNAMANMAGNAANAVANAVTNNGY